MKAIATSIVAAILLGIIILIRNSGITWDDLPQFGPK
jgi:predicted secreted protein